MLTSLLIAIGLNFDTFSVALVEGSQTLKRSLYNSLLVGLVFAVIQTGMALLGVFLGTGFKLIITNTDHWIAFILLSMVGGKLIRESSDTDNCDKKKNSINLMSLASLAIATSIDAIAVGVSLAFVSSSITLTIALIGIITFLVSFAGFYFAREWQNLCKNRVKLIGGLILIGIGAKILIEHIFFGG